MFVRLARPRALVLLLVGVLVFAAMAGVRPAEAAGTGSISGVVVDGDDQLVAGVRVSVDGPGRDDRSDWFTDSQGQFAAEGLSPGKHTVCFFADDHDLARECWDDHEMGRGMFTPVEVVEGERVSGIDAELLPNSYLRGIVTDSRGAPIEGALVNATWYPEPDGSSWGQPVETAEDGSYELGPLSSGDYTLRFSDTRLKRYATEWWDGAPKEAATRIVVKRGESPPRSNAVLADLAHIAGRVTGADGESVSGAVRVFKATPSGSFDEVGDRAALAADGTYESDGLQPGTYRVKFDAAPGKYRSEYWQDARSRGTAQDVVIAGTTPVTGVDAVLGLAPPVGLTRRPSISGRAELGQHLVVDRGAWDVASLRFSYQWLADGSKVASATGRRLLLTPRLRGKHIRVRVTATATAHERSPGVALTRRTPPIAPRPH